MADADGAPGRVGIDGCPAGWIAVSRAGAHVGADLAALLDRLAPAVAAIDMPIGLADAHLLLTY